MTITDLDASSAGPAVLAGPIDLTSADQGWKDVYATVIALLGGIVGEVYLDGLEVGPATRFEADLDLESMEIVQLAEELLTQYGERVDFVGWFGDMELDQIIDLSIEQLVTFIVRCLAVSAA